MSRTMIATPQLLKDERGQRLPRWCSGKEAPTDAGDTRVGPIPRSLAQEEPLEEGTATLSSILAWRIPGTEEPGEL